MTGFVPVVQPIMIVSPPAIKGNNHSKHRRNNNNSSNENDSNDDNHHIVVDNSGNNATNKLFVANVFNRFRGSSPKKAITNHNDHGKQIVRIAPSSGAAHQQLRRDDRIRHPREGEDDELIARRGRNDSLHCSLEKDDKTFLTVERIWDNATMSVHERCCHATVPNDWCQADIDDQETLPSRLVGALPPSSSSSTPPAAKSNDDRVSPTSIYHFPMSSEPGEGVDWEYATHDDTGALPSPNKLVHVDSIADESFQHWQWDDRHHRYDTAGSDNLMASAPTMSQDDDLRNRNLMQSPLHRGSSWTDRIGSSFSVGSSSIADSEDDDYYNSAIVRKVELGAAQHRPVGIRRDISNDRLYTRSHTKSPLIVPDADGMILDDALWKDIIQGEPKSNRVVSSILIRPPSLSSSSLRRSYSDSGSSSVLSSQSSTCRKVVFNDRMQVRYFQRSQEEQDEMRRYGSFLRKRKKKNRQRKGQQDNKRRDTSRKMSRRASSLLETINSHDDDDDDETDDNHEVTPPHDQGFEAIWDGSTFRRTSSSGSSISSSRRKRGDGNSRRMGRNRSSSSTGSRSNSRLRTSSSFPTKIVADLQLLTAFDADDDPVIKKNLSSTTPKGEQKHIVSQSAASADNNIAARLLPLSATFLFQGVMDDISGMLQGISFRESSKQQQKQQRQQQKQQETTDIKAKSPLPFVRVNSAKSLMDEEGKNSDSSSNNDDKVDESEYDEFGTLLSNYNHQDGNTTDNGRSRSSSMHDHRDESLCTNFPRHDIRAARLFPKRKSYPLAYKSDDEESWLCMALRCG